MNKWGKSVPNLKKILKYMKIQNIPAILPIRLSITPNLSRKFNPMGFPWRCSVTAIKTQYSPLVEVIKNKWMDIYIYIYATKISE